MSNTEPTVELDRRFSDPNAVASSWSDVRSAIAVAELFWISTVRSDGRPHVTPLPAVWHDESLFFCTGVTEQKAVNLARHRHCVLTTGTNSWKVGLDVVLEGEARRTTDETLLRRLASRWQTKYHGDWKFDVANNAFQHDAGEAIVFEVVIDKVLAFAKGTFGQTRFRFSRG